MSSLSNRRWCIVFVSDKASIDFSEVIENEATLRYSLDGTKFIVKYDGTKPACLSSYTDYTHSEILSLLSGSEWTSPDEP